MSEFQYYNAIIIINVGQNEILRFEKHSLTYVNSFLEICGRNFGIFSFID